METKTKALIIIAISLGFLISLAIIDLLAFICIISGSLIGFWIRPEFDKQFMERKKRKKQKKVKK